jgi:acetyl/propionyl-CoA carboxylase alpha subunit
VRLYGREGRRREGAHSQQEGLSRIAIVNRGEAAMRLIHAVWDLAADTATPIETVALHTDVDRTATFVRGSIVD